MEGQNLGPICALSIGSLFIRRKHQEINPMDNRLVVVTSTGRLYVYDIFNLAEDFDQDLKNSQKTYSERKAQLDFEN
jgi:alpha-tubulin suppressor-like RCC1 family protein